MPNKEHIKLWVEALRSGKYTQGHGNLQYKGKFCCLGVSCEVAIENGINVNVKSIDGFIVYDNESNYLPESVSAWLELAPDPSVGDELGLRAVRANDELRWNFKQIADSLERLYLTNGE